MSQPEQKKRKTITISGTDADIARVYDFVRNGRGERREIAIAQLHMCADGIARDTAHEDDIPDDKSIRDIIEKLESCIQDLKDVLSEQPIEIISQKSNI